MSAIALLCARSCPGLLIIATYDVAVALRDACVPVISGFHTPMEREALDFLLRGTQPITLVPARGAYDPGRLPAAWRQAIADGRLTIETPFPDHERRQTRALAERRNRWVAERAAAVLVIHAAPGGSTEALCREIAARGQPRFTLDDPANANLTALGFEPVTPEGAVAAWRRLVGDG